MTAKEMLASTYSAQNQQNFQEYMSNTAHVREVQDLKNAGLNPVLSAKLGGASTPVGASGNYADPETGIIMQALKTAQMAIYNDHGSSTGDSPMGYPESSPAGGADTLLSEGENQIKLIAEDPAGFFEKLGRWIYADENKGKDFRLYAPVKSALNGIGVKMTNGKWRLYTPTNGKAVAEGEGLGDMIEVLASHGGGVAKTLRRHDFENFENKNYLLSSLADKLVSKINGRSKVGSAIKKFFGYSGHTLANRNYKLDYYKVGYRKPR